VRTLAVAVGILTLAFGVVESNAADQPRLVFTQSPETRLADQGPRTYLCSADASGGSHFRLTNEAARDRGPAFRPQGDRVAYVRAAAEAPGLWTARADGTGAARFMETAVPVWSADGARLLVILGDGHIWSVGFPQGDRIRLTQAAETRLDLAASPDGTRLAYVRSRQADAQLVVLRLADRTETVVHTAPRIAEPSWSSGSTTLAFTSDFDVWTVGADGADARRIAEDASTPAFAPVADALAFVRNRDVWVMRADGSGQTNVTHSPIAEHEPAWQPTGSQAPADRLPCAIVGTDGDDVLVGTSGDDFIYGLGGDDTISALGGNDLVRDGSGNDTIDTGSGDDDAYGEGGHNSFRLGDGADELYFTSRAAGSQTADGGAGRDRMQGGGGRDRLSGGEGDDVVYGLKGADIIRGGPGRDELFGGRGDDSLDGGAGNDSLWGGFATRPSEPPFDYDGYDLLVGGSGGDALFGGWQKDRLFGGAGADNLLGGDHADYLSGGPGRDFLRGAGGDDLLLARDSERDIASGGAGFDRARLDPGDRRLSVERSIR